MEPVEIIPLTDTSRLVVEYDTDADCPRGDWEMLTGALTVRGDSRDIDIPTMHDFPGDLRDADDRLPFDAVITWARLFHGITVEYDTRRGTFWWVDPGKLHENWPDLEVGSPEYVTKELEVIAQEQETYRQWADGEVYGVTLQRLVTWARVDETGQPDRSFTRDDWEDQESLWGCYLDDHYTAADVAAENFPLTEDEKKAVTK